MVEKYPTQLPPINLRQYNLEYPVRHHSRNNEWAHGAPYISETQVPTTALQGSLETLRPDGPVHALHGLITRRPSIILGSGVFGTVAQQDSDSVIQNYGPGGQLQAHCTSHHQSWHILLFHMGLKPFIYRWGSLKVNYK